MLERRPGIYAITCSVTGKQYIGSSKSVLNRWWTHQSALRRGINHSLIMQNEWNKYGEDSFSCEAIEYVESHDDLIPREQYYIDTLHPELNIRTVADRNTNVNFSPESIEKMRAKLKVREFTAEHRHRISLAKKNVPHTPEQIQHMREAKAHMSAETRAKMSESARLRRERERDGNGRYSSEAKNQQALHNLREPIIPSTAEEWKQGLTAPSLWDEEASD